jgi:hypothetical protein
MYIEQYYLGFPLWAMRIVSLLMTATAFFLVLDLTLAGLRAGERMVRLATVVIFLTFPLLYEVGDALRWCPVFAVLVAGFFWLELRCGQPTAIDASRISWQLALASTIFTRPFLVSRYLLT